MADDIYLLVVIIYWNEKNEGQQNNKNKKIKHKLKRQKKEKSNKKGVLYNPAEHIWFYTGPRT
jgi:hypothetical protein